MLNGHIDVVPPGDPASWAHAAPFSGRVDGDVLRGRGSADMKAGLVAARWAVRALRRIEVPLRGDVLVASVASEEDGGLGTFGLLRRGWRADAAIVPEPTDLALVPACAGALTFRLVVRGKAAHASRRAEGVSAVDSFWPIHQALAELERERNRDPDPLLARWGIAYPLSIGVVRAGDWASSVPDAARGRRSPRRGARRVRRRRPPLAGGAVAAASERIRWLRDHPVEVEWWGGEFASCRLDRDSDLDDVVRRAHAVATDRLAARHLGRTVRERPPAAGGRRHPRRALRPRPHRSRPRRRRARVASTTCASRHASSRSRRSRSAAWPDPEPNRPWPGGPGPVAQPLPAGISPRRPAWKSSKACWISARVFMTNGP